MREGVRLANGRRTNLDFIWFGPRKTEFEKDEIERVYNEIRAASLEAIRNGTLPSSDEEERDERSERAEERELRWERPAVRRRVSPPAQPEQRRERGRSARLSSPSKRRKAA